jgi:hypothetical protein
MRPKKYKLVAFHTECGPIFIKDGQHLLQSLFLMFSQLADFDEDSFKLFEEVLYQEYQLNINDEEALQKSGVSVGYAREYHFNAWAEGAKIKPFLSSNDRKKAYLCACAVRHLLNMNGSFEYVSKELTLRIFVPELNDFDIVLKTGNNLYFCAKQESKC